ncbi:MAG: metalloregulator ArsR/SmtB family transcription factor [Candidatus Nanopelagicales bacterium]
MDQREYKDQVFGHFARIGAAFGHAKRVEIIDVLAQGERTVESLASQVSASVANTSRHLRILASAGLVTRRVEGTSRVYRVADPAVEAGYRTLVSLAEQHIADVAALTDAFFEQASGPRAVTFREFDELTRTGHVMLVDVRPPSEFAAGHVDGAVNIPVADLASRISELPSDTNIVAYCRGPYCVMAATAVAQLRDAGYDAVRLAGGYPQWRDAGRPVAAGSPA